MAGTRTVMGFARIPLHHRFSLNFQTPLKTGLIQMADPSGAFGGFSPSRPRFLVD
ncbi:hypothetical protein Pla52n_46170 [Stieleria varia]|uniref:Uncharacterized protein n=1 Tax=Stieleria varia TaxID=2528005 RepID=A0A5C6ASS1_9BACT|nr:hypothetical protein Pla52n_46170 [Stieleria varia]